MDFLKSTISAAISKGPPFPYTFHDRVDLQSTSSPSIFTLHNGTVQATGQNCSIFTFDINDRTRSLLPLAQNAVKRWRTLRLPGVVRVLDSVEVGVLGGSKGVKLWGLRRLIVRLLHLCCYREGYAVELAVEEKCVESGDDKVGIVECCGE